MWRKEHSQSLRLKKGKFFCKNTVLTKGASVLWFFPTLLSDGMMEVPFSVCAKFTALFHTTHVCTYVTCPLFG